MQIEGATGNGNILLEQGIEDKVRKELTEMKHRNPRIVCGWERSTFGCGQIIKRDPKTAVLCGGSDPRHDGYPIGY